MPRPKRPAGWLHHSHKQGPRWFRRTRLWFFHRRRTLLSNPTTAAIYKTVIGILGGAVILLGLILVPLPGPGWLVVFLGVAVVASEFAWARHVLLWGRQKLRAWTKWLAESHWTISALVSFATFAAVSAAVWATFKVIGVPAWVPEGITQLLFLD